MNPSATLAPIGAPPSRLGLLRRQSFDPLSSTKGSLTLGQLPPPTFGAIPNGLRSVPALDTNRYFGSAAFRNIVAPMGDGQRTPGGSLVIGAEVFGFGKYTPKESGTKARRSIDSDDLGGSDWPSEFSARTSTDDLRLPQEGRSKHGLDRLSGDFASSLLPRPHLVTARSSADLRPSSPGIMTDTLRAPSRSGLLPPSHLAHATTNDLDSANNSPLGSSGTLSDPSAASTGAATSPGGPSPYGSKYVDSTPSPNSGPYPYGYQPPDPSPPPLGNPYFAQAGFMPMSPPQLPRSQPGSYGGYGQQQQEPISPDGLTFGMRNLGLNGSNGGQGGGAAMNGNGTTRSGPTSHRAVYSPDPYAPQTSRDQPSRQSLGGFGPYFMTTPSSPYVGHQDPYSPLNFAPQSNYYDAPGGRRDSIQAPGWALPMPPFALPAEFAPPSTVPSRQGSFSYTPSGLPLPNGQQPQQLHQQQPQQQQQQIPQQQQQHYAPSAAPGFASPHLEHQVPPHLYAAPPSNGAVSGGPQLGQQHQIILGRARGVEYIAPGPVQQHQYGNGYGPDMRSLRSPLLEEFRSNRNRSWELMDLAGHIVEFSGDQLGSRHIQTKLDSASSEEKNIVFQEILPNMLQLSTDVFANYVIQKFFEQGSQVQKTAMARVLETHVLQLSLQMYGCRVVQKALEYVLVDQQIRLVNELDGHVLKCARDAQSNHVVQRALERVPPEHLHFITDACLNQVHGLATHPYGCRVLQRIFENCPPHQTRTLLDELHRYTQNLIQDQYGNYVVQWVIEKGEMVDRSAVISKLHGQVLPLAQQKFASNVVEKCILHATVEERHRLIEELLQPGLDGQSSIKVALVHPYANYVIQKALHCSIGPQREALFTEVTTQLINLRRYSQTYSKHLIAVGKLLATERERSGLPPLDFGGPSGYLDEGMGGPGGYGQHNGPPHHHGRY